MITDEIVYTGFGNWIMLGVGLWGGAKVSMFESLVLMLDLEL